MNVSGQTFRDIHDRKQSRGNGDFPRLGGRCSPDG
jgi:hypothetical protein